MKSGSRLEKILAAGYFAVTGECGPPRSADDKVIREKARHLIGHVDSVNMTDNQTSVVRLSSLAGSLILQQEGLEANMQMVCRDRNRIAMQSDILGACALGIKNLLCLSGDHQKFGDHPASKNVYDLDSMQLIQTVKMMRDERKLLSGQEMPEGSEPRLFIGAAVNPFADPFDYRVYRLAKKIEAGVDFVQTQCIYNMPKFREYMKRARDLGLTEKCHILAGVTPMKSLGMARYMANFVPGMDVPDELIKRIKGTGKKDQAAEGLRIAADMIQEMKEIPGVAGVHLMLIEWEERVPEMVQMAGLLPRPSVD
ncbi:MAG: methylenetetrahydrofolate reductase [Thermodesulfobacteriota bacterium]